MVYRIFVEKKKGLAHEAESLLSNRESQCFPEKNSSQKQNHRFPSENPAEKHW